MYILENDDSWNCFDVWYIVDHTVRLSLHEFGHIIAQKIFSTNVGIES